MSVTGRQVSWCLGDCRPSLRDSTFSALSTRICNEFVTMQQPLFLPVILGTARKGRRSENAARFVFEETKKRAGVETDFVDICKIPMRLDDAGEQMKDPVFSDLLTRADGLILP